MKQVAILWICISILGCKNSDSNSSKKEEYSLIYIDDGAIQCEFSGKPPEETAQVLIDNGIDVIESSCGYIKGLAVSAQCGLGDTNINIHRIPIQNTQDALDLGYSEVSELNDGYQDICNENA